MMNGPLNATVGWIHIYDYELNMDEITRDINYDDEDYDWENRHEYAFVVDVFAPSGPSYRYNLDDGTFETREIILTFTDIRRMYSIDMWVLSSIEDTVDV